MVCPAEFPTQTMAVTPAKKDSPPWNGPNRSHRSVSPSDSAVRSPASTLTRKSLGGLYAGIFCRVGRGKWGWARAGQGRRVGQVAAIPRKILHRSSAKDRARRIYT